MLESFHGKSMSEIKKIVDIDLYNRVMKGRKSKEEQEEIKTEEKKRKFLE